MATEADLIQKFKDLDIPVGADFEELIHAAFASSNLADQINSKADDSKVVHTADMRKPANQVASIDEVNAKQDKIGYTPADDSKVLHSTIVRSSGTDLNTMMTAGFFRILNGLNTAPNSDNLTIYQVIPLSGKNGVQIAYNTNNSMLARRSWHAAGSIVFSSWIQSSDDSKVAHLSGANNFDTTPTVNNNPLLLASSLPSDLARTSQQTNFTAGLQSGGVNVATAADIKSVEESAWRELDLSGTSGLYQGKMRIKIDDANKTIYLDGAMYFPEAVDINQNDKLIDLSGVVNNVTSSHGYLFFVLGANEHAGGVDGVDDCGSTLKYNSHFITVGTNVYQPGGTNYVLPFPDQGKTTIYVTYDELV